MTRIRIGKRSDFPDESMRVIEVDDKDVLVTSVALEIYATEARCPHQGYPLAEARREGFVIICPLHGAQYDVRTGKRLKGFQTRDLRSYPVSYDGEYVFIDI